MYKLNLVLRILVIVASALFAGWAVYNLPLYAPLMAGVFVFFQVVSLVEFVNGIHERIGYFFESIVNDDFSLTPNRPVKDPILNRLHRNMDKVNAKIRQSILETQEQEQYFRALIEHVHIGILTFDEKGFVVHANSSLLKLLGVEHLSHLKQLQKYDEKLAEVIGQMKFLQQQQLVSLSGKPNRKNLLVKSAPFKSKQRLTLVTVHDIEQHLEEKELESWIKLIRVLTHEIMNGIAPITSLSESLSYIFLEEGVPLPVDKLDGQKIKTVLRGLDVINEQGERLKKLVESFRKITRLPTPNKTNVALKPFLEKSILLSKAGYYEVGVNIDLKMDSETMTVQADDKQLTQVVLNILKNSFEAVQDVPDPKVEVTVADMDSSLEIRIQNNGPEIPKDLIDEIFVPFFTTKEDGSGIGLSLSKQIMRLHGGALKVHSTPSATTFVIVFFG